MSLSRREQVLGTFTLLAVLFGAVGLTARSRLDVWNVKAEQVAKLRRLCDSERELVGMGDLWRKRYDAVRDQMPVFEPGRQVDTYWLSRMDALAESFGVRINRRQVGREELVGDVYEFPIECREWEGSLDAFVHFLHGMQAEGAMLDVRDLTIRPHASARGVLRGSFTLYCAYMRGASATTNGVVVASAAVTTNAPPVSSPSVPATAEPSAVAEPEAPGVLP